MDEKLEKIYVPMTETAFYILFNLREKNHGYGITQAVESQTNGDLVIAPGTMYGTLKKMEDDGLITFVKSEEKRKIYVITDLGREVLDREIARIKRLYKNAVEDNNGN